MQNQVAIFWDYDNIHASVMLQQFGDNWYYNHKGKPSPNVVKISAIMDYASSIGNVVLNRAYANWQWMSRYAGDLNEQAIELIQLFPRGRGKNGADILLSIDIVDYLAMLPDIETVIIVSGDGDFIPVAKRIRRQGKSVIGIGVKATTNAFFIKTCNEFKFYDNIVKSTITSPRDSDTPFAVDANDLEEARKLLVKAVKSVIRRRGSEWVELVRLKPVIVRMDPSFDEQSFGYNSFGEFTKAQTDLLEQRHIEGKQEAEFRVRKGIQIDLEQKDEVDQGSPQATYDYIFQKQKFRFADPLVILTGLKVYGQMIDDGGIYDDYDQVDEECLNRLKAEDLQVDIHDASKLRHLFYKVHIFKMLYDTNQITFFEDVGGRDGLTERFLKLLVKRISTNIADDVIAEELAKYVFGDGSVFAEQLQEIIDNQ
jgi:uncharacterized LabA/DUF88 family protein